MSEEIPNKVSGDPELNEGISASVALPGGGWVVIWQSENGYFLTSFDEFGKRSSVDIELDTPSMERPQFAALSDGGFIISYSRDDSLGSPEIHFLRLDSTGDIVGGERTITPDVPYDRLSGSAVSGLENGGWVVAVGADTSEGLSPIALQIYDKNGNAVGTTIEVLPSTNLEEISHPEITSLTGGGFVLAWLEYDRETQASSSALQAFDATGNPVGARVTDLATLYPHVAATADGGWISAAGGEAGEIVVNHYDLHGEVVWTATTYNGHWGGNGLGGDALDIVSLADGTTVVASISEHNEVFFTRFDDDGTIIETSYVDGNVFGVSLAALSGGGWTISLTQLIAEPWSGRYDYDARQYTFDKDGKMIVQPGLYSYGTAGDDLLSPSFEVEAPQRVYGYGGDDTVRGAILETYLDGGAGTDTLDYSLVSAAVHVDLSSHASVFSAPDGRKDEVRNFERIGGSRYDDTLLGDLGNNTITGASGDDKLGGRGGDDTLIGGMGKDYISGGVGSDTANYISATAGLAVSLSNPSINTGDAKGDTFNSIENLSGTKFNDGLNGNNSVNTIRGRDGNDTIKGYSGNDLLFGDGGDDTLIGGIGADALTGGAGTDTASYQNATAGVVASLANPAINTGEGAGDTYSSIENITGSAFNDFVYGNSSNNTVNGGAGNDTLKGYAGNDILTGGSGKDAFMFNTALSATTNVDRITDFSVVDDTIRLDNIIFTALTATGVLSSAAFRTNNTGLAGDSSDRLIYEQDTGELYYDANGTGSGGGVLFGKIGVGLSLTNSDFLVI